ncbi:Dip1-like protein [Elsinoe fawcettii]|nr:Dip1-like protein [Elsinoe fawcettii]
MEAEEEDHFDGPDDFRKRIHDIVSSPCDSHEAIDDSLRQFIEAVSSFHRDHPDLVGDNVEHGCYELLTADLFTANRDYVRRQFIYSLMQEDEYPILQIMTTFLIYDGKHDEETFVMMQNEGLFPRLIELIKSGRYEDTLVHKLLLELLCEMTRIQVLSRDDLKMVDDAFILYLFQLIEQLTDDPSDPYHNAIIRILLVLNEQYMCFESDDTTDTNTTDPIPNRIIKILSSYGPAYRAFGENLILLLNRESTLGPQLLILKILYLLFTTPQTYEYFYTNDLHVLVDVIMRNLVDLDPGFDDDDSPTHFSEGTGNKALRHTYLRVLYPLLKNTQLAREDGNYKTEELRRLLRLLVSSSSQHFAPADSTVLRLVSRCRQIDWIRDELDDVSDLDSPSAKSPPSDADVAKRLLGMTNIEAGISSLSVLDVTAKVEKEDKKQKPAVPPPRRLKKVADVSQNPAQNGNGKLKVKPVVPKPRRARSEQIRDRSPFSDDSPG